MLPANHAYVQGEIKRRRVESDPLSVACEADASACDTRASSGAEEGRGCGMWALIRDLHKASGEARIG